MLTDSQAPVIDVVIFGSQDGFDATGILERDDGDGAFVRVERDCTVLRRFDQVDVLRWREIEN